MVCLKKRKTGGNSQLQMQGISSPTNGIVKKNPGACPACWLSQWYPWLQDLACPRGDPATWSPNLTVP